MGRLLSLGLDRGLCAGLLRRAICVDLRFLTPLASTAAAASAATTGPRFAFRFGFASRRAPFDSGALRLFSFSLRRLSLLIATRLLAFRSLLALTRGFALFRSFGTRLATAPPFVALILLRFAPAASPDPALVTPAA